MKDVEGASENKPQHTSAEKWDPTRSTKAVVPLKEGKGQASPAQTMPTVPQDEQKETWGCWRECRPIIQKYEDEMGEYPSDLRLYSRVSYLILSPKCENFESELG
jgi:hypothetical protein